MTLEELLKTKVKLNTGIGSPVELSPTFNIIVISEEETFNGKTGVYLSISSPDKDIKPVRCLLCGNNIYKLY